jgi:high-affinity iron transporter
MDIENEFHFQYRIVRVLKPMLQALIITLREGVEAALIVGIALAYLSKIGRDPLRKLVYWALGAACAASIAVAVVLARTGWSQDIFEGWVMLAAAVFVASMVLFMMRAGKTMRKDIEQKMGGLTSAGSQFGLFLFIFLMVLREGVETVLVLSAVSLNSSDLMNFLGTLLGIGLAFAFGVMFVKGTIRVNLQKFFKVTTVILFFVAAQLLISGLHELSENGVVPSNRQEMAIIGPIVRNDLFFFITILALAALMILMEYRRRTPQPAPDASSAETRKAAWSARRERFWMASVYVSAFVFIFLVTAQFIYAKSASALSPAKEVQFSDGKITIPEADVNDGDLHRYVADIDGMRIRFFLIAKPDGSVATVFDACEICGSQGFYHDSRLGVVCKNCSAPLNVQSVGQGGGCNPVPLKATHTGGFITITKADVAAGAVHFHP